DADASPAATGRDRLPGPQPLTTSARPDAQRPIGARQPPTHTLTPRENAESCTSSHTIVAPGGMSKTTLAESELPGLTTFHIASPLPLATTPAPVSAA